MEQAVLILNVLAALGIVGLIMIQQGKGADMGASFGAGASQTLFGSGGGGSVLTKATALLVTVFFVTSFGLAVIAKNKAGVAVGVGMPMPAMVESKDMPQAPTAASDIPEIDGAAIEQAIQVDELDIPAGNEPLAADAEVPEV